MSGPPPDGTLGETPKWGGRKMWAEWDVLPVLHIGQGVAVYRWQNGGHWEWGEVQELLIQIRPSEPPIPIAGIDLRRWWRDHVKTQRGGRPPVAVIMRANTYWLKDYRVEITEAPKWHKEPQR